MEIHTSNGNDVVFDGWASGFSICDDDLDIVMGGGDDDAICIGTVVMERCTIRMGGDNDATGIENSAFGQARIYGNGAYDIYSARNNIVASLIVGQYEVENANVQARVNQAGLHPTFEAAAEFFESLDLDE